MKINLSRCKQLSAMMPLQFFDDKKEFNQYTEEFPEVLKDIAYSPEDRFTGKTTVEVFSKSIEYVPRSLIGRHIQTWMAHRLMYLLNTENKANVLDYGCGAGNMGMIFAMAGFNTDFADVGGVITDFVKWLVERNFLRSNVFTHTENLDKDRYDLVCMQNVMEHLDEPLDVLKKLTMAMRKGAYFLITFNTSGKGLDVVTQETYETTLLPYLLENFNIVPDTDKMLYQKK